MFKEEVWCCGWSTRLETRRPGFKSLLGQGNWEERECVARLLKPPLEISLTLQMLEGSQIWFFVFHPQNSKDNSAQSHPFLGEKKNISLEASWIKHIKNVSFWDVPSSCFYWTGLRPHLSLSYSGSKRRGTQRQAGRRIIPLTHVMKGAAYCIRWDVSHCSFKIILTCLSH